ncbi:anti-sigma factor RsbA family regulatory protein [Lentzea sp. NPDC102401]|uniref:anti-sigma factor RsbA family regulatory protein n=1 Tax=Lentzea sp. NPDC102401 TaxID=3364128 RepID=UPI00380C94E6
MKESFLHQGCIYGSDAEFLAMAVPFVQDGQRRGEPVLVATTRPNQDLLRDVIGWKTEGVEYADDGHLGHRPPQHATAIHHYWSRHQSAGAVRVLAEPEWTGRSGREMEAFNRMEAALNVVLADTEIWMICPYDTRVVEADVLEDVRRTHPECVVGGRAEPSSQFMAPEEFARLRSSSQPQSIAADLFRFEGELAAVRRYVLNTATALLRSDEDAVGMFGIAVGEAITYLARQGVDRAAVWVRPAADRVVCTLHSDTPLDHVHPFVGYRPPGAIERPGDGLWLTNQICEWLDVTSDASGCTIELAMPAQAADDLRRAENSRLSFGS